MNLALRIARRYLISKKSHSAINFISIVSICGVAVTTMALVCTLSIYNGFGELVASLYSTLDPQIKVVPIKGKTLDTLSPQVAELALWPEIDVFSPVLEEHVLAVYRERQMPALIKGVPDNFAQQTDIDQILLDGSFMLSDSVADYATMGVGLANLLGTGARFMHPLEIYAPKRNAKVNLSNPASSFANGNLFMTGVFTVNQPEYDDQLVIVPLEFARELFDYTTEASSLEIKLKPGVNEDKTIARIKELLGDNFMVKNRMEQQEESFRMMQIEKWMTFLILSFILMIASFNVIGSISMLIIDKQKDIRTLQHLGANDSLLSRIFLSEGWIISILGAGSGIVLGVILCLLQQEFGFLQLGQHAGAFVVDAYPVKLIFSDVCIVLAVVTSLGFMASWYPVKYLRNKWLKQSQEN